MASWLAIFFVVAAAAYVVYALYFHPLREYPGPWYAAVTRLPYWIVCIRGKQVKYMLKLHRKYGPVVRYAPNDLSYSDGRAWKDICNVPKGKKENVKQATFHAPPANGVANIVIEHSSERHSTVRRTFLPAFSEKALRSQESLFQKYADLMITRAREAGEANMAQLLNFATFDIMADFAFGESLHLLEKNEYSNWVATVFDTIKVLPYLQVIQFYPLTRMLFEKFEPKPVLKLRMDHFKHTVERVDKRLKEGSTDKQDLFSFVVDADTLTPGEIYINAELFMTAGTETTASLLTGALYHLMSNPEKLKILVEEVRSSFNSNDEITFERLANLEYLNACLKEGLRVYPSVPTGLPREIAAGGNIILDKWVPEGVRVSVHQMATYRSSQNFKNADKFAPERWLGDPIYANDNRESHQPFSVGPRNCLGMNMAWHEMRLLLGKLIWNFDIDSDVGPEWADQNVFVIWDRKPLMCRLKDVRA